jgi:hypothetical protein
MLGWLAGFIDGEGSIGLYKVKYGYSPRVTVANTSTEALNKVVEITRLLNIGITGSDATMKNSTMRTVKLSISKRADIQTLLDAVRPFLAGKANEADIMLGYLAGSLTGEDASDALKKAKRRPGVMIIGRPMLYNQRLYSQSN